jgi:hypothetical protein
MMLRIGRYGIAFGYAFWVQTHVLIQTRHFLCFWFFKEAKPTDIDKKKQFTLGTPMEYEGRKYYYCRKVGKEADK